MSDQVVIKPNSNKYKEAQGEKKEKKPVEQIVKAKTRKTPITKRLADVFFADTIDDFKVYLVKEIVIPGIQDMIVNSVERLFGRTGSKRAGSGASAPYISYNKPVSRSTTVTTYGQDRRRRADRAYENIVIPTRPDAERLVEELYGEALEYGLVSVSELYAMCGLTPNYTDEDFGWTKEDFDRVGYNIERVSDGYILKLPRARALK